MVCSKHFAAEVFKSTMHDNQGSGVRTEDVNATTTAQPTLMESIREAMERIMGSGSSQLTKIILTAEISSECSLGLLNLMRGIWNLDPWAVRLLDATGKYANGLFVGTQSDLGSFDECLETIVHDEFGHERVRGQYCNVQLNILNDSSFAVAMAPAFRMSHRRAETFYKFATDADFARMSIGLCVTDDCSLDDLRAIAKAATGNHVQVKVHDCVTILDATGKYSSGLFVGTQSDLGSFDECLETIVHDEFGHERVRGQYCNVQLNILNDTSFAIAMAPAFRMSHRRAETFYKFATDADFARMSIGLCVTDDCSLDDLRAIAKAATGNHVQVKVHDCVTSKYRNLTKTETAIL
ncbi:hypothetical protein ISCGN_014344 [Ixodes scapularis]